ncbi:MAG: hypothetical protein EBU90_12770 [Proteobacteria bacterium]|nr:hypothetical protein [Pseudomonadota bacterium]NBP14870.1 hypothetical protein [bacterium]
MYLLFKTVSEPEMGLVRRIGSWLNYVVGYLDDSVKDIVITEHLNATVIPSQEVAYAWKFAGNHTGYVSVRAGTLSNEQLDIISSTEPTGEKARYYLTDEDKSNAITFMKLALRKMLDDVYDKRVLEVKLNVSDLEYKTWPIQLSEAQNYKKDTNYSTPMLSALASVRNITLIEMVDKVISANIDYTGKIAQLLAAKQIIEIEIKDCQTIRDLNVIVHSRYGYNMPPTQAEELGITSSSVYNL